MGAVSAVGLGVEENYQSLKAGHSGIGNISLLDTIHKGEIPVCEIKYSNADLLHLLELEHSQSFTRTTLLGLLAAKEAMNAAKFTESASLRTGFINATTVGGMSITENIYYELRDLTKQGDFLHFIDTHDCGDCTERIADYLGIHHIISTISTACSSAANALMYGARLIKNGQIDRVLCGGVDSLSKFTINGFNTLMILDRAHCRPFDDSRVGLNLGEGAAYLMLEGEETVKKYNRTVLAELTGYANTNDAFHQTAASPEGNGAYQAMAQALQMSGRSKEQIQYINTHGTATPNNDLSEGRAMYRLFDGQIPPFSSTKPFTGHTLAACGAIEAVYAVLAIQHGIIYPSLNFSKPMNELDIRPVTKFTEGVKVENVLSNSFGFGGNNTSLIISKA
jgi:3-oxoacyl-[acyl-carrier-protein] synthase-1